MDEKTIAKIIIGLGSLAISLTGSYICKKKINEFAEKLIEKEAIRQGIVKTNGEEVIAVSYVIHE